MKKGDCLQWGSLLINFKMSECFVFMDCNDNDLNVNKQPPPPCFFGGFAIWIKLEARRVLHSKKEFGIIGRAVWGGGGGGGQTSTLLHYFRRHVSALSINKPVQNRRKGTAELAAAAPKVDNYDETSRGEAAVARRDIPPSDPAPPPPLPPPSGPLASLPQGTIRAVALTDWQIRLISTFHPS